MPQARVQTAVAAVAVLAALAGVGVYYALRRPPERKERLMPTPLEAPARKVLVSPLAGQWYEGNATRLTQELDGFLSNAPPPKLENVHALILPHAGYQWSGQTAACGLATIAGRSFSRVVVMGPSHRVAMNNRASVPDVTHLATPLGEVPLDTDFLAALRKHPYFQSVPEVHQAEHSVQIQVPFLQHVLGEFRLVPIVLGQLDLDTARTVATILLGLIDEDTLVVASSDFTHYGWNFGYVPFRDDIAANLEKLDMGAFAAIERKDTVAFLDYVADTGATICGRCPIAVLLSMLPETSTVHLLKYDTSGNMTGDFGNSVSYVSVAFTGTWDGAKAEAAPEESAMLTDEDKENLLKLARGTLTYYMAHHRMPTPDELGVPITPGMRQKMGAFVTLHEAGRLRGCIGEIESRRAVYEAVMDRVIRSALHDYRFPPVEEAEVPNLHIEISALSPPRPVASYHDIVLGKHGVILEKGHTGAVYLPQVAPEQGWDIEQTLTHLAQKAGLPPDAWKEGASFTVFEAIVFGEPKV